MEMETWGMYAFGHIVQERCDAGVGGVPTDQKEVKEVL